MRALTLEVLFPRFCLGCGFVGAYICPTCKARLIKIKKQRCLYCEKPSPFGFTHPACRRKNGVDACYSLCLYEGLFIKLLQEAKYKGAREVLEEILKLSQTDTFTIVSQWVRLFAPIVASVPLHPQRVKERGFNQSRIITDLCFSSLIKKNEELIERKTNTLHLANITDKTERKKHIKGAFLYVGKMSPPKAIILVDDVITSGSTMKECAKVLKEAGVQTVLAFSLAKG